MGKKIEEKKLKIVIEALASVSEAYEMTPRSTLKVGALEKIAEDLLEKLK